MRGGRLRHKCEIHQRVVTRNAYGEEITSYTLFKTRRCRLIPKSVSQSYSDERVQARAKVVLSIRYTPGIDATMRVLFQGRWFDLIGPQNPDDRRKEMTLDCEEVSND